MANVKCPICGKTFDRSKVEYVHLNGRYYHRTCCSDDFIYQEKMYDYLKKIWGICSKPKILKQVQNIQKEYGYTIKEIYGDLKYFYDVKNNDTTTYKNTINIVPYVHDEAQKYYRLLEYKETKKENLAQKLEQVAIEDRVVYVSKQPKRKKIMFELEVEKG